jgi:hypothetical protein
MNVFSVFWVKTYFMGRKRDTYTATSYPALRAALTTVSVQEAPAAIYGHSMDAHWDWWVDTAEI